MANESNSKIRKADADAGPASAKKAKVTPKTAESKKKSPSSKDQTTGKAADKQPGTDDTTLHAAFTWKAFANEPDAFKRLEIKEEAVRQGLRHAERIRSILISFIKPPPDSTRHADSGTVELQNWTDNFDDLKKQNSEFRVFIGFAGVTGAGKTSAINSIIGFRDLLPSSNEAAATAVPCLIAYNDDPDPDAKFRAEVSFKTEHDIRRELDQYFEALTVLEEVRKGSQSQDSDPDEAIQPDNTSESAEKARHARMTDHLKDVDTVETDNQDLLDMVSAVFGLDETDLKAETTESLLTNHPDVHNLLGQMIHVVGSDVEEFSERIKPYMDSVPAAHGSTGVEFAAWPLINEVKIFVRSPVLKNGIVLVDLPGLADNVESRASVAQNYFSKLSVTAIVAPIIRARNEQTAVNLMTENQQFCMQMDGKFHRKSFCVILSKMDDINVDTYLKQHSREANLNQALQTSRDTLKTVNQEFKEIEREKSNNKQILKDIDRQVSRLQADHDKAEAKDTKATKADELAECKKRKVEAQVKDIAIDRRLQLNRKQAKHLYSRILHWCYQGRNTLVETEIQTDFQRRQKRLAAASKRQDLYDGTVMTFPISSSAYWKVIQDSEPPAGFPAVEYTGIPALKHWLRYSAIPDREKHLDMVLNALHGLFNTMKVWSSFQFQGQLNLTKKFVNDEVLHRPLHHFDVALNKAFNKLCKDINQLNPMKNKDSTVANCKQRCITVVKHWSSREPDNLLCRTKMHWNTYNACVARCGAVYRAKSQGKHRYAWIETLCNLFYEGIVKDWNLALNEQIPALRAPADEKIDEIWAVLMSQLEKRVRIVAPQMQPVLGKERDRLDQIKDQLKDMVGKQFDAISVGASKAHRTITNSVKDKYEVAFRKAKKEKGKGMYERQQHHLIRHAELKGSNMFKDSTDKIDNKLRDQLKSVKKDFHSITVDVHIRLRDLIMLMLDGPIKSEDGDTGMVTSPGKEGVQQEIQQVVMEWAAKWCFEIEMDLDMKIRDTAIPEVYYDEVEEADDSEVDDINDESYREFLARDSENDDFPH